MNIWRLCYPTSTHLGSRKMGGRGRRTATTQSNSCLANNWWLDVIQLVVFKTSCRTKFTLFPLSLCHPCQDVKPPHCAAVFKISSISYQLHSASFYVKNSSLVAWVKPTGFPSNWFVWSSGPPEMLGSCSELRPHWCWLELGHFHLLIKPQSPRWRTDERRWLLRVAEKQGTHHVLGERVGEGENQTVVPTRCFSQVLGGQWPASFSNGWWCGNNGAGEKERE